MVKSTVEHLTLDDLLKDGCYGVQVAYGDAAHAWCPITGRSTAGSVCMLYGGPTAWSSKSIKLIVRGTRDSEAMAVCAATESAMWAREWLADFGLMRSSEVATIYTDSKALIDGMGDGRFQSCRSAILQAGRMMRQEISDGRIEMHHLCGDNMVADILTKSETGSWFESLAAVLVGEKKADLRTAGVFGSATRTDYE